MNRLTKTKAMQSNCLTIAKSGYTITTVKRDFLLPKIRASYDQFLKIGVRAIRGNKASNRTNNASGLFAVVVESLRLLIFKGALFLISYGVTKP